MMILFLFVSICSGHLGEHWETNILSTEHVNVNDKEITYYVMENGNWHADSCSVIGNNEVGLFKHLNNSNDNSDARRLNPYYGTNGGQWTNGIVPVDITKYNGVFDKQLYDEMVKEFKTKTGIQIIERTNEVDYIEIINGNGCYSTIGKQGGKQELSLQDTGCFSLPTIVHEFGHGMYLF